MIYIGNKIIGKWNKKEYRIIKKIGSGGIGQIFKVKDEFDNIYALKISEDMTTINREYEFLKKLENFTFSPNVYDLDDYIDDRKYYFFVMDYIDGVDLKQIIKKNSINTTTIIGICLILLKILKKIYELGYVYCDIKLENILLDLDNKKIILIDYGGVIEKDKNIREYTPVYSVSSWGIDIKNINYEKMMIFSVSMILVSMYFRKEFNPSKYNINDIIIEVKEIKSSDSLKETLIKGLYVSYNNMSEFINSLKNSLMELKDYYKKNKINKRIDVIFNFSIFLFVIFLILSGLKLII